eukprot:3437561-Rhodomonas_salina.4
MSVPGSTKRTRRQIAEATCHALFGPWPAGFAAGSSIRYVSSSIRYLSMDSRLVGAYAISVQHIV